MSLWENPIKKDYDRLINENKKEESKEEKIEEVKESKEENIIDLSTIMATNTQTEEINQQPSIGGNYIVSPNFAAYNGSRGEYFEAMKIAKLANIYLDYLMLNSMNNNNTLH